MVGEYYYTKKNQYSINLYAIYNSSKKFIYAITGYSGATHDVQVWGLTLEIYQNPSRYFLSSEYLLRDSAYPPTRIIVPPYKGVAKKTLKIKSLIDIYQVFNSILNMHLLCSKVD